jgi:two-component sensor histidine kinase
LANYLFQSYSLDNRKVSLKLEVENVFLGMDTAVPLGIIINELVSNSLKHAFVNQKEGEIYIELYSNELYKEYTPIDASSEDQIPKNPQTNPGIIINKETNKLTRIAESREGKLVLIVRDNGIGFPKELDFRNTNSLGLQLVTALVEQLEGSIKLDITKGTKFEIRFVKR